MYRIEWMCLITNTKSNGDWFELKDKTMLEDNIKHMNEKYLGEIQHWLGEKSRVRFFGVFMKKENWTPKPRNLGLLFLVFGDSKMTWNPRTAEQSVGIVQKCPEKSSWFAS